MFFQRYNFRFWLLCLSTFFFFVSFNLILPELNNYITSLGGAEYKGLIIGLFTIAALISRPFSGRLADTIGRLPVVFVGTAVCVIMGALYPFVQTVAGFLLLRFFHGFSTGFQPTGTTAYLADTIPADKRGEAMGFLGIAGSLGMSAGPSMSDFIVPVFGLDGMFYTSSLSALLSLLCLWGLSETLENRQRFSVSALAVWREKIYDPAVMPAAIVLLMSTFSFGLILTIAPDYAEHVGLADKKGLFFGVFTIASLSSRLLAGRASDRHGRPPVIMIALLTICAGMTTIALSDSPTTFFIGGAIFGFGAGMNSPSVFAWTIDLGHHRQRAKGVATVFMGLEAGIFTGAVVSAEIYSNDPANFPLTFFSGAIMAFATFLYLFIYTRVVRTS